MIRRRDWRERYPDLWLAEQVADLPPLSRAELQRAGRQKPSRETLRRLRQLRIKWKILVVWFGLSRAWLDRIWGDRQPPKHCPQCGCVLRRST